MLVQNIEALKQKMALSQTGEKKKDEVPPLNSQTVPEDEKFDYHSPNHSENSMIETSSGIYTDIIGNLYSSQDFKVMNHIPNQPNLNSPNEKLEIPQLPPPTFQQYESHLPLPNFQQYESQQPNQPNQPQQYLETNLIHSQQITTQASAPLMQSQPVTNVNYNNQFPSYFNHPGGTSIFATNMRYVLSQNHMLLNQPILIRDYIGNVCFLISGNFESGQPLTISDAKTAIVLLRIYQEVPLQLFSICDPLTNQKVATINQKKKPTSVEMEVFKSAKN